MQEPFDACEHRWQTQPRRWEKLIHPPPEVGAEWLSQEVQRCETCGAVRFVERGDLLLAQEKPTE